MALTIKMIDHTSEGYKSMAMYTSSERLYLDPTRTKVVGESSEDAAYLLVGKGGQIPLEDAIKYGLADEPDKAPVQEVSGMLGKLMGRDTKEEVDNEVTTEESESKSVDPDKHEVRDKAVHSTSSKVENK